MGDKNALFRLRQNLENYTFQEMSVMFNHHLLLDSVATTEIHAGYHPNGVLHFPLCVNCYYYCIVF